VLYLDTEVGPRVIKMEEDGGGGKVGYCMDFRAFHFIASKAEKILYQNTLLSYILSPRTIG
jgi:hypothetical protein